MPVTYYFHSFVHSFTKFFVCSLAAHTHTHTQEMNIKSAVEATANNRISFYCLYIQALFTAFAGGVSFFYETLLFSSIKRKNAHASKDRKVSLPTKIYLF